MGRDISGLRIVNDKFGGVTKWYIRYSMCKINGQGKHVNPCPQHLYKPVYIAVLETTTFFSFIEHYRNTDSPILPSTHSLHVKRLIARYIVSSDPSYCPQGINE
ncbi:hypothetical protein RND81_13G080000 [Saponaria officinalis]|uniref:Uncharacterized protein n=1 Tax=Saponaria officinalis TaxID=3572 RepID=A0AAW1GXA9_SAPOF